MWTSVGVLAGVALVWLTGVGWIDPLVAILMAVNIGWMAVRLLRRSVRGLMEEVNASESGAILQELDRAVAKGLVAGYHQVRYRRVHAQLWIEYHLLFPGDLSLAEAHARSHAVEQAIALLFTDEVIVTAHLEPEAHEAAHPRGHAEPADPLREGKG
jgi:divalent metal cation (Fe/Co/Zn/Cd) transporter